jgi:hypothetical protein
MIKRISQPAAPAATMVITLPHHLGRLAGVGSGLCCPVPSHPLGDFKNKPAEGSEADAQKSMTETTTFPFCFLQNACDLSRSTKNNKLLMPNRSNSVFTIRAGFRSTSHATP